MNINNLHIRIADYPSTDLVVVRAEIHDGIGQIPTMQLEVDTTEPAPWNAIAGLRGKSASLRAEDTTGQTRNYAGVIHSVEARLGPDGAAAGLRLHMSGWPRTPKSHSKGYRFFQDKTAVEIATDIFTGGNNSVALGSQNPSVKKRTYQVQYGESDQAFVSRLLLREQLLFRVATQADQTGAGLQATLHVFSELADLPTDPQAIEFAPTHTQTNGLKTGFYDASVHYHTAPDVLSRASYSTQQPNVDLRATTPVNGSEGGQWIEVETHDLCDDRADGQSRVERQLKALRAQRYSLACDLLRVASGSIYSITGLALNPRGQTRLAVVTARQVFNRVAATGGWALEGRFDAVSPEDPFAPAVPPAPVLPGLLRGVVVARQGDALEPAYAQLGNDDTVDTDPFGRIRVRMLWHGEVRADDDPVADAPWLRLMTPWAGSSAGFFALPRAGQEVMVSFVNGDAEQPVVMGAVYGESESGASTPPWSMPDGAKWVGIGTRSQEGAQQFLRLDASDPAKDNEGVELYSASRMRIEAAKEAELIADAVYIGKDDAPSERVLEKEDLNIDTIAFAQKNVDREKKMTEKIRIRSNNLFIDNAKQVANSSNDEWAIKPVSKTRTDRSWTKTGHSTAHTGKAEIAVGAQAAVYGISNGTHGMYTFGYGLGVTYQGGNITFQGVSVTTSGISVADGWGAIKSNAIDLASHYFKEDKSDTEVHTGGISAFIKIIQLHL